MYFAQIYRSLFVHIVNNAKKEASEKEEAMVARCDEIIAEAKYSGNNAGVLKEIDAYEITVEGGITRLLALFKDVDVEKIGLNDYVTFTINVTNIGPSNATNVIIKDVLPNGLIYYDSTGDYDPDDSSLKIPLMKPGDSLEFNISSKTKTLSSDDIEKFTNRLVDHMAQNNISLRA